MKHFNPYDSHLLDRVRASFNQSASQYDAIALPHRKIGDRLLEKLLPIYNKPSSIADIGAGTGYMSEKLHAHFPEAHFTLNDISPEMLHQSHEKFKNKNQFTFVESPMETLQLPFQDLIISNLALQWSNELHKTLTKLKQTSRLFAFTTLLKGTFQEWTDRMPQDHFSFVKNYPNLKELSAYCLSISGPNEFFHWTEDFNLSFPNALEFLKHLKNLGAHIEGPRTSINDLLIFLRQAPKPFTTYYKVFFGIFYQDL